MSSVPAFERYHRIQAQLWERQALIKARAAVGDHRLMEQANDLFEHFVYAGAIGAGAAATSGFDDNLRPRRPHEEGQHGGNHQGASIHWEKIPSFLRGRGRSRFISRLWNTAG